MTNLDTVPNLFRGGRSTVCKELDLFLFMVKITFTVWLVDIVSRCGWSVWFVGSCIMGCNRWETGGLCVGWVGW